ncbi:MAG: sigma-70 family RNA polymerase sigma factor [Geminicoccaceae bacterium]|nr:MAG: sigma-70 family RNA polymerase sigma factor [Geminicoccaceae bacterium]
MTVFREDVAAAMPDLRAYARSLCAGNIHDADDLVQDTLARALAAQHRFTPGTNLHAWLFTILRNVFLNGKRASKRHVDVADEDLATMLWVAPHQEARLEFNAFRAAFERLSGAHREALVMATIEGRDYADIAERTGCRVGTVKSRINRARNQLRADLMGSDPTPAPAPTQPLDASAEAEGGKRSAEDGVRLI